MKNKDKFLSRVDSTSRPRPGAFKGITARRSKIGFMLLLLMFMLSYSSANVYAQTYTIGPVSPAIGAGDGQTYTNYFQVFDVLDPSGLIIQSVDLYPSATIGSSFTIVLQNSLQAVIATYSGTTTVTGSNTPQTVPVNFTVPFGTGYRIGFSTNPGMVRNSAGAVYPYTVPGLMSITNSTFSGYPQYYYWFYNIQISPAAPPVANDAGIEDIVNPTSPLTPGTHMVTVKVKNYGTSNLNNTLIQWSVNGVAKTPKPWVGNLAAGASVNFDLFNQSFPAGTYTVKAWTNLPNGQFDSNAMNDTATVQVISCNPLNGIYTVGPTGTYPSIQAALDVIATCGISGPVTLNLETGTYTGQVTLPQVAGLDATKTVTIQSATGNAADVVLNYAVTGSADNWTLKFDGADYFTVKNITIMTDPTVTTDYAKVVVFDNGADYNTLENCVIVGKPTTNDSDADWRTVHCGGANDANYTTITGNTITGGVYGIYFYGGSGSGLLNGNIIANNTISDFTYYGVYFGYQKNGTIEGNTVVPNAVPYSTVYGYYVYYSDSANLVKGNKALMSQTSTSGTVYGINTYYCDGTATNPLVVANNWVSLISGGATLYGIYSTTGTSQRFYHNSVQVLAGDGASEYAMYLSGGTDIQAANNIFANFTGGYAAYGTSATAVTYLDYNNYYATGTNKFYLGGTNFPNLTAWQAGTGADAHSYDFDPFFASAIDPTPANTPMDNKGMPIPGITTDIFGTVRSLTTPDIGAVEYTGTSATMSLTAGAACDGNLMVIPVSAQNFTNVAAMSLALNHGAGFSYSGIQNVHPSLSGILANGSAGQAFVSWVSGTGLGVNLPSGLLFELVFNTITPGTYDFSWETGSNGCEVVKGDGVLLNVSFVGASSTVTPCSNISGSLRYNNTMALPPIANTALGNVTITLFDGSKAAVATSTTNAAGNYSFTDIPNGTYGIGYTITKPWGGVNSVDALLALRHGANYQPPLTGIHKEAGDVNNDGFTAAVDALLIARRSVGQIPSFVTGDWLFGSEMIELGSDTTFNIFGICYGDCNGTYAPAKNQPMVSLTTAGSMNVAATGEIMIPFSALQAMELGAIALEIGIPQGMEILDVEMAQGNGDFLWTMEDNVLRLSWFSLEPILAEAGQPVFYLRTLLNAAPKGNFSILGESELANGAADVYANAMLSTPKLVAEEMPSALQVDVYPNPFSGQANLSFSLPEAGQVEVNLYDISGAEIMTLVNEKAGAGHHSRTFSAQGLAEGVYLLKVIQGESQAYTRINLIK
jgi:parallel beta-helix repeat protein